MRNCLLLSLELTETSLTHYFMYLCYDPNGSRAQMHLGIRAFDTELVVIAEKLNITISEVGVIWHEIDGSKLDIGKVSLAMVSLGMLRDMVCVRACYILGIWKLRR